jgi:peptidoglycan-associated lipoprotein
MSALSVWPKALLIIATLTLAACQNPDRYGGGSGTAGAGGTGGTGGTGGIGGGAIDSSNLGDPSNPASPAYFNATVGDRVHFVVDQSTLTDEARGILDGQARWLLANPQYAVIVEGHADEQGTREYNLALGARRASAVQQYLISKGVAPARIQTVTYGKERPIAVCSDETCYAQNRRAVTVLQVSSGV